MRRVVRVLLAALIAWLGLVASVGQANASLIVAIQVHTYEVHHGSATSATATSERGPPHATYTYTPYDAVGLRSHGASARPEGLATPSGTTYDYPALLAQVARPTTIAGTQVEATRGVLSSFQRSDVAAKTGATVGHAASTNYRATFFAANPGLEGQVVVHHAVEQQVLRRYPGLFSEAEIHSLENLRGIPVGSNSSLHLSQIRRSWNAFYRSNASPTRTDILNHATEVDRLFGTQYLPPIG